MADNYTQFSEEYEVTPEQIVFVKHVLETIDGLVVSLDYGKDLSQDENVSSLAKTLECDIDWIDNCIDHGVSIGFNEPTLGITNNTPTMWVHAEESGIPEFVAYLLKAMLKSTNSNSILSLTWSGSCSRLRLGEFGGGWFAVSKNEIVFGNTWTSANKDTKKLAAKLRKENKKL